MDIIGSKNSNGSTTRFLILTSARSGSNLVSSVINSHPNAISKGEVFNLDSINRETARMALLDPVNHLNNNLYLDHHPNIKAVGFKMMYAHASEWYFDFATKQHIMNSGHGKLKSKILEFDKVVKDVGRDHVRESMKGVWDSLSKDSELIIIDLFRENTLKQYISSKVAISTNSWTNYFGSSKITRIRFDPQEFFTYSEQLTTRRQARLGLFRENKVISIKYEDFVRDIDANSISLQNGLGLSHRRPLIPLRKQSKRSMGETVENFPEMRAALVGTEWEQFLEV